MKHPFIEQPKNKTCFILVLLIFFCNHYLDFNGINFYNNIIFFVLFLSFLESSMYKINILLACIFIVFTGCESKKPNKIAKKEVNRKMEDLKTRISRYMETGYGVYHDPKLDIKVGHIVRLFIVGGIDLFPEIISSFSSRKDALIALENRAKYDALVRFSEYLGSSVQNSENGTIKIKTDFKFTNVKLVRSTLKEDDSCRVVYQWDRILEENNKYLLNGEIAGETLGSENQDSGLSNTCKKI